MTNLISMFPLICLGSSIITALLSEGYRKGNPPNHKMSQLFSIIAIILVGLGMLTMGAIV